VSPRRTWSPRGLGLLIFALACVLLVVVGWATFRRMTDMLEANRWVDRALTTRAELEVLVSFAKDAETGERGFLITDDRSYLGPYDVARASVGGHLDRLRALIADNPKQQANLATLDRLIQRRLAQLRATITARWREGFEAAARLEATGEGKRIMDDLRVVAAAMQAEEDRLLAERTALAERRARAAMATSLGGLALAMTCFLAASVLLNRSSQERERERLERSTAETVAAAVAASEARLRITLASIGDAVIATDHLGRVTLVNAVAQSLTGWSDAEAIGRPLADVLTIVDEQSRRPVESPIDGVLRDGKIAGLANHTVLIARDGREMPIDDSAAPISAADGSILGAVLVFRDISQRRQVEREHAALLEQAEDASRAKDEFLALLSHDLRTPLTAMLGWVKLLRAGMLDATASARALEVIERNVHYQTRLISDLVDVSRIAAGKLTLDVRVADLAPLVEGVIETVRPAAAARAVNVTSVLDRAAGPVRGDAGRLHQVIANLVDNAVKFTPAGGRVEVRLAGVESRVRITVSDTGKGIAAAFLPHVFDPFRQADAVEARARGGLGLGLAIVRRIVELHTGTVSASSEGEGKGATFIVDLPCAADVDAMPARAETVTAAVRPDVTTVRGLRVLVVDDDADTRELVAAALVHHGARVTVVASVVEAREAFKKAPPDVIVCDIVMPGENGFTLISEVRALRPKVGATVPAVALSAHVRPTDRDQALAAGFDRFLAKPVDPLELIKLLAALHRERSSAA
jgi:PAS domain S-box-containing protein